MRVFPRPRLAVSSADGVRSPALWSHLFQHSHAGPPGGDPGPALRELPFREAQERRQVVAQVVHSVSPQVMSSPSWMGLARPSSPLSSMIWFLVFRHQFLWVSNLFFSAGE